MRHLIAALLDRQFRRGLSDIICKIAVSPYRLPKDGRLARIAADDLQREQRHAAGKRHNPRSGYSS